MKKAAKPLALTLVILALSSGFMVAFSSSLNLVEKTVLASSALGGLPDSRVTVPEMAGVEVQALRLLPQDQGIPVPVLTAAGVLVEDLDTGTVLYSKDADKRVPIASTTKIMTALVASEHYSSDDILTVPPTASVSGSLMGIKVGERLTFRSLLYGMLLNSGNDAAFALAGDYPGGGSVFVEMMNEKARQLNLVNSHFDNPAGFDSPRHFSSAADLAKITISALDNPQLAKIFATKETVVASVDGDAVHPLKNLNRLLGLGGVIGVKTGFTPYAKENLVGLVQRNNHRILTVVLGSDDRFGETEKLINWAYQNFLWP